MKLIQEVMEAAKNAAQAQENLNQAVINGESTTVALQDLASYVGAQKAQLFLDHARKSVAEKNERTDEARSDAWGKQKSSNVIAD